MLFKKACTVYTCSTNYHLKKKIFIPETYQYPIPIIKHAAKQVKDQNIQINVDDALLQIKSIAILNHIRFCFSIVDKKMSTE